MKRFCFSSRATTVQLLPLLLVTFCLSQTGAHPFRQLLTGGNNESCLGKCTLGYVPGAECQCNSQCSKYNNCCSDYVEICTSCTGRCGQGVDKNYGCQCNSACSNFNDCCKDYDALCRADKPVVTDEDLRSISEKLKSLEVNNVGDAIVIDIGGKSTACGNDNAPKKLFVSVDESVVLSKPTFAAFSALMDNYKDNVKIVEDRTTAERAEENRFLDEVLATDVMKSALQFMTEKALFDGDTSDFKKLLTQLWFDLYDRDGTAQDVAGSSGFEHVFIGEYRDQGVQGFHNWYSYYKQEVLGNINYYGYIDYIDYGTGNGKGHSGVFTWNGRSKCYGSMPIGTSPELELALYTICFYARPEVKCSMSLNNLPIQITTFPLVYKSVTHVGTAYADWK